MKTKSISIILFLLIFGINCFVIKGNESTLQSENNNYSNTNTLVSREGDIKTQFGEDIDRQILLDLDNDYVVQPYVFDFDDDGILEIAVISNLANLTERSIYLLKNEKIVSGWPIALFWDITDIKIVGKIYIAGNPRLIIQYSQIINSKHVTSFLALKPNGDVDGSYGFSLVGKFHGDTILYDINGDGSEEMVLAETNGAVYCLTKMGQNITNWPQKINESINFISPVVDDINNDNQLDIILVSDKGLIFAWNQNGSLIIGYPFRIPFLYYESGEEVRETPVVADLNGDGSKELCIGSIYSYLYIVELTRPNNRSWIAELPLAVYSNTQIAAFDTDHDGYMEIVQVLSDSIIEYRLNKTLEHVFTYVSGTTFYGDPVFADITRDNKAEIIVSNLLYLTILTDEGEIVRQISRWTSVSSTVTPLIFDIDNDEEIEIVHLSLRGVIYINEVEDYGFATWIYKMGSPTNAIDLDKDKDGLWDFEEVILGTNVNNNDTDGDTALDGLEINQYALNPLVPDINEDSDGDGLTNIVEVDEYSTDPRNIDSDGDTISDGDEVLIYHTNPLSSDTDDDGMPDNYEIQYDTLNPLDPSDAKEDYDKDNLKNLDEMSWQTDPENPDTDGDGLLDGDEVNKYFTNPTVQDSDADYDDDGLTNVEEVDIYGTDPSLPDTDGDGYSDGEEVAAHSDPLDPNSIPAKRTTFPTTGFLSVVTFIILVLLFKLRAYKKTNKNQFN
ncbi:MAG: FG-GAP-like repeat-containing protein [Candidatus Heimdallarchaeaceae archaeon]